MSERRSARTSLSLFLSTALHGSVIALIALGPTFIPGLANKGDRSSKNIEFSVTEASPVSATLAPSVAQSAPAAVEVPVVEAKPAVVPPPEIKTLPTIAAQKPVIKKAQKIQDQKLPEKAADKIVEAQPAVVVEESPVVEETLVAEETAIADVPPATEEPPVTEIAAEEEYLVKEIKEVQVVPAPQQEETVTTKEETVATKEDVITPVAAEAGVGVDKSADSNANKTSVAVTQNYTGLSQLEGNKPPTYTRNMRIKKLQGRGQLVYYVNKDGLISDIRLSKSTGSSELDQAALSAFEKYKFVPGQEGYTKHDFEFNLSGPEQSDSSRLRTTMAH